MTQEEIDKDKIQEASRVAPHAAEAALALYNSTGNTEAKRRIMTIVDGLLCLRDNVLRYADDAIRTQQENQALREYKYHWSVLKLEDITCALGRAINRDIIS